MYDTGRNKSIRGDAWKIRGIEVYRSAVILVNLIPHLISKTISVCEVVVLYLLVLLKPKIYISLTSVS